MSSREISKVLSIADRVEKPHKVPEEPKLQIWCAGEKPTEKEEDWANENLPEDDWSEDEESGEEEWSEEEEA